MKIKNHATPPPARPDLHGDDRTRFITLDDVRQKTGQYKLEEPKSNKLAVIGTFTVLIALGVGITMFNKKSPAPNVVIEEPTEQRVKFLSRTVDTNSNRDDFHPQQMKNYQPAMIGADNTVPTNTPRPSHEDSSERSPAYTEYEPPEESLPLEELPPMEEF